MWNHAALATFCGLTLLSPTDAQPPYPPRVGEPHPDFVLPRIDNRQAVALSDFRGQKVLLIQFASW